MKSQLDIAVYKKIKNDLIEVQKKRIEFLDARWDALEAEADAARVVNGELRDQLDNDWKESNERQMASVRDATLAEAAGVVLPLIHEWREPEDEGFVAASNASLRYAIKQINALRRRTAPEGVQQSETEQPTDAQIQKYIHAQIREENGGWTQDEDYD